MAGAPFAGPEAGTRHRPPWRLLWVMGGLIVWAVQFTVIYGFTAVACARGLEVVTVLGFGLVPFVIVAATLVALALTGVLFWLALRHHRRQADEQTHPTDQFLTYSTLLISGLSLVAIAYNGLPALIVPVCT